MYAIEQFIQSSFLLVILSVLSMFSSKAPCLCLLFSGILFILFAIRSVSENERESILFLGVQAAGVIPFVLVSGSPFACLIFYEIRIQGAVQIILPAVSYGVIQVLAQSQALPEVLCSILLLIVLSLALHITEKIIAGCLFARNQMLRAVNMAAVSEMYQKKLNQELVLKNYLTDKNARLEERENISRTIHNSVGHSITAAIMTLDAADMLFDTAPEKAREKMKAANERIHTSLESIRHAVRLLDKGNAPISIGDLISGLNVVTERFITDTMICIREDFKDLDARLLVPHEHAEFLIGAVQEILTNGVRHGAADTFTVHLTADSRHIRLSVLDNGRSDFSKHNAQDRLKSGFGLKKLLSYAKKCGGTASFTNENGFCSIITLPLYEEGSV